MLTLQVISHHKDSLGPDYQVSFDKLGGSIGRSLGNEWVLPDPERVVSGEHAIIVYSNRTYLVEDVSTNGVYVGDADEPIGSGNRVELHNGDILHIGDYEILVTIGQAVSVAPFFDASLADSAETAVSATRALPDEPSVWPTEGAAGAPFDGVGAALYDDSSTLVSLEAGHADEPLAQPALEASPSEADHQPGDLQFFQLPEASIEPVPEDWDLSESLPDARHVPAGDLSPSLGMRDKASGESSALSAKLTESSCVTPAPLSILDPSASASGVPQSPTRQPQTMVAAISTQAAQASGDQQPPTFLKVHDVDDAVAAFMRGVGVDLSKVEQMTPADCLDMMERLGSTYRCMIDGMLDIMMARARLKREFRLDMTMIRPTENNPLKFSAGSDDALEHLLFQRSSGFMSAEQAFSEAFSDLKEHEMAMVAGMRAIFNQTMDRFDPKKLETTFASAVPGGLATALGGRESRYWRLYKQEHERLVGEAREHFLDFFGIEFAKAYEEQICTMARDRNEN